MLASPLPPLLIRIVLINNDTPKTPPTHAIPKAKQRYIVSHSCTDSYSGQNAVIESFEF